MCKSSSSFNIFAKITTLKVEHWQLVDSYPPPTLPINFNIYLSISSSYMVLFAHFSSTFFFLHHPPSYKNLLFFKVMKVVHKSCPQGERGHWAVYSFRFKMKFSYSLAQHIWEFFKILIGWFNKFSVQTFQPLIVLHKGGNFVYYQFIGHCIIPLDPWVTQATPYFKRLLKAK